MVDPLTEVVSLLQPRAPYSKVVRGSGAWRIRHSEGGRPFYCVVVEGSCRIAIEGQPPFTVQQGDFVLIPSLHAFSVSSHASPSSDILETTPVQLSTGEFALGDWREPPDVQFLVGHCIFGSPDSALLVSLLPRLVHIRGDKRLATIVQLVVDECRSQRPARDMVLERLLEVLMIETMRSTTKNPKSPGLVGALSDERIAISIRRMHENLAHPWTIEQLARESTLSRSAFYERFTGVMGVAPMKYLFAVRMALAKRLLQKNGEAGVTSIAERTGYGSASAFSIAFIRHVGVSPARYAREQMQESSQENKATSQNVLDSLGSQ